MARTSTISGAARLLGISRRTVQRYCQSNPEIKEGQRVNVELLRVAITFRQSSDARGFPLGGKRPAKSFAFDLPAKPKPIVRRTLAQRLEIIAREIDAMTDAEQRQILSQSSLVNQMFRPQNFPLLRNS